MSVWTRWMCSLVVLEDNMREVYIRLDKIENAIANLANTLDAFLKRLTAHEQEFEILKNFPAAGQESFKRKTAD